MNGTFPCWPTGFNGTHEDEDGNERHLVGNSDWPACMDLADSLYNIEHCREGDTMACTFNGVYQAPISDSKQFYVLGFGARVYAFLNLTMGMHYSCMHMYVGRSAA